MRHLKKFNESSNIEDTKRDIIDNFSYLIDTLGDPIISNKNWGDKHKWVIKFNLEMDISLMNNALDVINKLKSITQDIEDIISASERLSDYYFQMSIKDWLIIEMIPKVEKSESYNFIINQSWREIQLNLVDIEKFFSSNGINLIKKWFDDDSYIEVSEVCASYFKFDKFDDVVFAEFISMFTNETNSKLDSEEIDREIVAEYNGDNTIQIYPTEEKTYVVY
jgi:hypothetical protein